MNRSESEYTRPVVGAAEIKSGTAAAEAKSTKSRDDADQPRRRECLLRRKRSTHN